MLGFSVITSIWAISIHDNVPLLPFKLFLYSTHHSIHHELGRGQMSNYGKFTSVWDRIMSTYWDPDRIEYGMEGWEEKKKAFLKVNQAFDVVCKDKSTEYLNLKYGSKKKK